MYSQAHRRPGPVQVEREKKQHTIPPTSLVGQLLWREFFYAAGAGTPNYDRMEGNPVCKQVPQPLPAAQKGLLTRACDRSSARTPVLCTCSVCLTAVCGWHTMYTRCLPSPGPQQGELLPPSA